MDEGWSATGANVDSSRERLGEGSDDDWSGRRVDDEVRTTKWKAADRAAATWGSWGPRRAFAFFSLTLAPRRCPLPPSCSPRFHSGVDQCRTLPSISYLYFCVVHGRAPHRLSAFDRSSRTSVVQLGVQPTRRRRSASSPLIPMTGHNTHYWRRPSGTMRISFATFSKLKGSETVVTSTGFIPSSSR